MGWRSVIVSQPARLSLHNRQLRLEQDGGLEVEVPLEDISIVVLETPQALITTALLTAFAEQAIAVLTCDATHHPNGVLLPPSAAMPANPCTAQADHADRTTEKRAWQRIVAQKLTNQAQVLAENQAEWGAIAAPISQQGALWRPGQSRRPRCALLFRQPVWPGLYPHPRQ